MPLRLGIMTSQMTISGLSSKIFSQASSPLPLVPMTSV